jgi:hypothetical protein
MSDHQNVMSSKRHDSSSERDMFSEQPQYIGQEGHSYKWIHLDTMKIGIRKIYCSELNFLKLLEIWNLCELWVYIPFSE